MQQQKVSRGLVLALVMVSSFITPFIGASVNLALPLIGKDFGLNAVGMSWVTMAFLLSSAVFLVPIGKIADIAGRKRVFFWGNIIMAISSVLCAISPSGAVLITFRAVQGLGSAMVFATGVALITSVFPPSDRGKAIGLNVTSVYIGLSAAPLIGGLLISWFGWESLFYVPAFLGIFSALSIRMAVRSEWADARGENFDFAGAAIYFPSMTLFMYGFSQLPDPVAVCLTILGFIGLIFFVRVELRASYPVFNVRLFRNNRLFAMSNVAALINYATTFAITFVLSLYLQYIKGLSPREAGLLLIVQPLLMAFVSSWSGKMSDKHDPRILASLGMGIIAVGLALLIPIGKNTSITYLIVAQAILGFGFGLFSSPNTNSVMGSVEKKFLGIASGTVATMRLTGQMASMGIATLILQLYIGKSDINPGNYRQFGWSVGTTFTVFVLLCIIGVWASLARGKNNGNSMRELNPENEMERIA